MEPENNKTYMCLSLVTFVAIMGAMAFLWMNIEQYKQPDKVQEHSRDFFKTGP